MPGQTIGTQLPPLAETIFDGHIIIRKQGTTYTLAWSFEGDKAIGQRTQDLFADIVKKLNGE